MKRRVFMALAAVLVGCTQSPRGAAPVVEAKAPAAAIAQTAHPLATKAALEMLARGGNAIDAIVAAQAMLGLVEPQMSGIGGGTLILYWDAHAGKLASFDGTASAPARTTESLRTDVDGRALPPSAVRHGGRSVGVPGTLPVLEMVHKRYGKLPWKDLFGPAVDVAERGFPMPEYMHRILVEDNISLAEYPTLRMFFDGEGKRLPVGSMRAIPPMRPRCGEWPRAARARFSPRAELSGS
jgi:gamma-glutamyltranspeptidase / glutathione hydrolase